MDKKILNWRQAVEAVNSNISLSQKDLASLIIYARKSGIGESFSYQLTSYSKEDLEKLKILINWWSYVNDHTASEWRDKNTAENFQKVISESVSSDKPIFFYSVFCPSYKKGVGAFGYTGKTGDHTREVIKQMCNFILKTKELGLKLESVAYFSDLLLENFDKLKGTDYKSDLESNYKDFSEIVSDNSNGFVKSKKLSEITEFEQKIGENGILEGEIELPDNIYNRVFDRNKVFYENELGWSDEMTKRRTEVLARCYIYMGDYFRKNFPLGIMYWTESAYERGAMYSGNNQRNPIPIIYPNK